MPRTPFGAFSALKARSNNLFDQVKKVIVQSRTPIKENRREQGYVENVAYDGDGQKIFSLNTDTGLMGIDGGSMNVLFWWKSLALPKDVVAPVRAIAYDAINNVFYVGGYFSKIGGVSASNVAKYDPSTRTFSALSSGLDNNVYGLAVDASGNLYATGQFTNAGGDANADRVAKWNGSAWSALGTGLNDIGRVIKIASNGDIYVGGDFTLAGGVANTARIAKWNGSAWSALGTGMNSDVLALALDSSSNLFAAGVFTLAGGVANTARIAKWNGSAWSALGTGLNNIAYSLATDSSDNVFVSGAFSSADGVSCIRIAKWDGSAFSALAGGLNDRANALAINSIGTLFAGGEFTNSGYAYFAQWDGSAWSAVGDGLNNIVNSALAVEADVYVGGSFTSDFNGEVGLWYFVKWGAATLKEVLSELLIASNKSSSILGAGLGETINAVTTGYAPVGSDVFLTTEYSFIIPRAGFLRNLYFNTLTSQPASGSLVATLRLNGAATALTVTVSAGGAAQILSDITHGVAVAAGDKICMQCVNNATAVSARVESWSVELL